MSKPVGKVTVEIHVYRLCKLYAPKDDEGEFLDELTKTGSQEMGDLYNELLDALTAAKDEVLEAEKDETKKLRVRNLVSDDNLGLLFGHVYYGESGMAYPILDETGETAYDVPEANWPGMPFYFAIRIAEKSRRCIVLLQRFKTHGIKVLFDEMLKNIRLDHFPEYTVRSSTVLLPGYIDDIIEQLDLNRISFVQHSLPTDITDKLGLTDKSSTKSVGEFKHSIQGLGQALWSRLLSGSKTLDGFKDKVHEIINSTKYLEGSEAHIRMGNRTLRLDELETGLRPYYDITDEVNAVGGLPDMDSVGEEVRKLLRTTVEFFEGTCDF